MENNIKRFQPQKTYQNRREAEFPMPPQTEWHFGWQLVGSTVDIWHGVTYGLQSASVGKSSIEPGQPHAQFYNSASGFLHNMYRQGCKHTIFYIHKLTRSVNYLFVSSCSAFFKFFFNPICSKDNSFFASYTFLLTFLMQWRL